MDLTDGKQLAESLEYRDNLLKAVNDAANVLLTAEDESFEASLLSGMEHMGRVVHTDRVFILKNQMVDGERHFVYLYEWINGGAHVEKGTKYPYSIDVEWSQRFARGECMNGPLHSLTPNARNFFSRTPMKSILVIPIFINEHFWGLVSFSDCENERIFTDDEISILQSGALMMVSAINRNTQAAIIRESHKRTRLLLDAVPLACHLWDRNLNVFEVNEEAVKLFNAPNKQYVIEKHTSFSPENQPDGQRTEDKTQMVLKKAFDEGKCVFEWLHKTYDGQPLPAEITLIPLDFEGEHIIAAYARDLREHKQMMNEIRDNAAKLEIAVREAQTANSAKSDFLAGMSHEMRTPLNAVIGLSSLTLEMKGLDEEAKTNLEKIYNAGATLLSIVNDILDISKIEAGKLELILNEYDTPSLINDAVTSNILRIGDKPIEFHLDIRPDMPTHLFGDELRIKQILSNLLSNAIKYTKEGTVELGMRTEHAQDDDTVWLTAWVRDTGMGIRPEDINKLFSDYSQVDTKANRRVEGTGLGLAITKKMIELMDGTITVESEYGKGSVFTTKIKQRFVTDVPIGENVVNNLKSFRYSDNKRRKSSRLVYFKMPYARVLVVDDNITNLDVAKGLMKPYEMRIDCVTSGQQAIDAVRAEKVKFDAIFMDHMMPEMDGIEATRHIRAIGTDYAKNIPIIALTANAIAGNDKMFLNEGFQAFLSKPINLPQLHSIIKRWIRDKSKEEPASSDPAKEVSGQCEIHDQTIESELPDIPGVDIQKGLELYSGMTDVYLPVLRSYAENTPALIEKLRDVAEDTLSSYAIHVHGLKGASAGIGAEDIRQKALSLEMMAKAGDLRGVIAINDAFIAETEALLANMHSWFARRDDCSAKLRLNAPNPDVLARLRQSLLDYDMSDIDGAMEELEKADYEVGADLTTWLKEKITDSEFEEAANRITNILENIV